MKKLFIIVFSVLLLVLAGPTLAAKPDPKTIRHCGCSYVEIDGEGEASMVFHDITVAGKSKGHRNHVANAEDIEFCFAGTVDEEATYDEFVRDQADCLVDGEDSDIADCGLEGPAEFAECGSPFVEPPL